MMREGAFLLPRRSLWNRMHLWRCASSSRSQRKDLCRFLGQTSMSLLSRL